MQKKLAKLGNKRVAFRPVLKYIPALVNHLYHVVANTGLGQLRQDWWVSAANHVCGIHDHELETFPQCVHGEEDEETVDENGDTWQIKYIVPGIKHPIYICVALQIHASYKCHHYVAYATSS